MLYNIAYFTPQLENLPEGPLRESNTVQDVSHRQKIMLIEIYCS